MDIVQQLKEISDEIKSIRNKVDFIEVYDKYERKHVKQPRNIFYQDIYNFIRASQQRTKSAIITVGTILTLLEIINIIIQVI